MFPDNSTVKQQCGGELLDEDDTYDLPLHVAAIFIILLASIIGCGFPVLAKKIPSLRIPPCIFFITKHFGTGVLLATAFVHLLPTAFISLSNPCLPDLFIEHYTALPGVIVMTSLLMLFCVELWISGKTGGHSHGSAKGEGILQHATPMGMRRMDSDSSARDGKTYPPTYRSRSVSSDTYPRPTSPFPEEKHGRSPGSLFSRFGDQETLQVQSEMPAWFIAFYAQYVRQRDQMRSELQRALPSSPFHTIPLSDPPSIPFNISQTIDPLVLKKMNMNISLLEAGILFHSVFVGMTISITSEGFLVLLIAMVFHQFFEGLGLGSRIAEVPYPAKSVRPWMLVLAFGVTCPVGQAVGLATRGSYDPASAFALVMVGGFNAFSSGLLIYAAIVDLLAEDFLSEKAQAELMGKEKWWGVFWVLMGALGMAVVGAFA